MSQGNIPVLFVDDEQDATELFSRVMRRRGFDVFTATSGVEALEIAEKRSFPVIVTDLRMPGMDGLSLIDQLQPIQPDCAFVLVTGLFELDARSNQLADRAISSVVGKPWNNEELESTLREAAELHHQRRAPGAHTAGGWRSGAGSVLIALQNDDDLAHIQACLGPNDASDGIRVSRTLAEARACLEELPSEVIVVDMALSDRGLLDAVAKLQQCAPDSAIVVLSEDDDEALAVQALRLGAQDYLVKGSYQAQGLKRAIRYAAERKHSERRLAFFTHHDHLTGLANRATFREQVARALHRARRKAGSLAVLFFDLDRFKHVNDSFGHDAGDALIQTVSDRLRCCIREYDVAARLGGDEFAILVDELDDVGCVEEIAQRVLTELAPPIRVGDTDVFVTASIGIAVFPTAADDVAGLLQKADHAMYAAKERGRNCYEFYREDDGATPSSYLRIQSDLRRAVETQSFRLHYQPQYNVQSGGVMGFEALLRWPRGGAEAIGPAQFVPILEDTGLIAEVSKWVLNTACHTLRSWHDEGHTHLRMAVNLSAHQFEHPSLIAQVREALDKSGVGPEFLELEITEGLLMRDTQRTNRALLELKRLGVRIAIDDFGTGYSSLAYLKRFAVDVLKIDRAFVNVLPQAIGQSLAETIISLGHRLGLEVVAEGVETDAQLQALRRGGCDSVQGYLLGRPQAEWEWNDLVQPPTRFGTGSGTHKL